MQLNKIEIKLKNLNSSVLNVASISLNKINDFSVSPFKSHRFYKYINSFNFV